MLCSLCEIQLREHEDYFAKTWYQQAPLPAVVPDDTPLRAPNFDYRHFKLFHLSQLWRAAASTLPDFASIELGAHFDRVRQMLLSADPGPPEAYALAATVIVKAATREVVHELIAIHSPYRERGARAYAAIYAGCAWRIIVASHSVMHACSLRHDSPLIADVATLEQFESLYELLESRKNPHET